LITNPETCDVWLKSSANELGRLGQGIKDQYPGTNTIKFISINEVSKGHTVTYG
jgi:hypothetical protein